MNRSRITELYYITPIENIPSILQLGIVSNNRSRVLHCKSIADAEIQKRRQKLVPGTQNELHHYVNLYFNPRNPMMFKRKDLHQEICVIQIANLILDLPRVVITDGNASSGYIGFYPSPEGLTHLNEDLVYARDWTHLDQFEAWRRKRCICAEVLVPEIVGVEFIRGICVSCDVSLAITTQALHGHPLVRHLSINTDLFFR